MNNIKILYYFNADDGSVFIELKRLDYKNSHDKSKYVSWFRLKDNKPTQLNFIRMDKDIRYFKEGKIIINDNSNMFIENKKCINLKYCYINIDNIKLCAENWN